MRIACLKQPVTCFIVRADGRVFEGTNSCAPQNCGQPHMVCPREFLGKQSGEDYELCDSTHAEIEAAKLAEGSASVPGEAFIFGHTYVCGPCQRRLAEVNVHRFTVVPPGGLAREQLGDLRNKLLMARLEGKVISCVICSDVTSRWATVSRSVVVRERTASWP